MQGASEPLESLVQHSFSVPVPWMARGFEDRVSSIGLGSGIVHFGLGSRERGLAEPAARLGRLRSEHRHHECTKQPVGFRDGGAAALVKPPMQDEHERRGDMPSEELRRNGWAPRSR